MPLLLVQMGVNPAVALDWGVKQMQAHAAELKTLIANSFTSHTIVSATELNHLLLEIEELANQLDQASLVCSEALHVEEPKPVNEVITSAEEEYATLNEWMAEQEHNEVPTTLEDLCEQFGVEYDSDQSRGF